MAKDGSLLVDEVIAFDFAGDFSGAFREVPLGDGQTLDQVSVAEGNVEYAPGACAELQCSDALGTFGTTRTDKGVRIVWHYRASFEQRRFRVHYRLRGVATAYDDVVDVNVKVWGDEWEVGLAQLTGALVAPGDVTRAWGHPVGIRGDVTIDGARADLRALDIPPGQFVELRALVPRRVFASTAGMKVESGPGLEKIVASTELSCYVSQTERGQMLIGAEFDSQPSFSRISSFDALRSYAWKITRILPFLREMRILRTWAGSCDISVDFSPIMGLTPADGFLVTTGWGTWGFKAIPAGGEAMAELIATGRPPELIAPFALARFRDDLALADQGSAGTR